MWKISGLCYIVYANLQHNIWWLTARYTMTYNTIYDDLKHDIRWLTTKFTMTYNTIYDDLWYDIWWLTIIVENSSTILYSWQLNMTLGDWYSEWCPGNNNTMISILIFMQIWISQIRFGYFKMYHRYCSAWLRLKQTWK